MAKPESSTSLSTQGNRAILLLTGIALGVVLTLGVGQAVDMFVGGLQPETRDSINFVNPEAQELSFRFFDMLTQSDTIDTTQENRPPPLQNIVSTPQPTRDGMSGQAAPSAGTDYQDTPAPIRPTTPEQADISLPESASTPQPSTPRLEIQTNARYFLQAGSFRAHDKAETLRARILLLGLPSRTSRVTVPGGGVWHRVFVGPYETRQQMEGAADRLRAEDIDPLPLYRTS